VHGRFDRETYRSGRAPSTAERGGTSFRRATWSPIGPTDPEGSASGSTRVHCEERSGADPGLFWVVTLGRGRLLFLGLHGKCRWWRDGGRWGKTGWARVVTRSLFEPRHCGKMTACARRRVFRKGSREQRVRNIVETPKFRSESNPFGRKRGHCRLFDETKQTSRKRKYTYARARCWVSIRVTRTLAGGNFCSVNYRHFECSTISSRQKYDASFVQNILEQWIRNIRSHIFFFRLWTDN